MNASHEWILAEMERIYRFAYHRVPEQDAGDLTQEILVAALSHAHTVREEEKRIPWLWGVARNVYKRYLSGRREIPMEMTIIEGMSEIDYETPEDELIDSADAERIRRAVAYLAKIYREVCVLYYLEEKSYAQIADMLSIPLSSVKWRLNESKKQLKEELEKMEFMNKGYRSAKAMQLSIGGYVGTTRGSGNYDGADQALTSLLARNICIAAYPAAKNVTELAAELGVAADYIEDSVNNLCRTQCLTQTQNRYRTAFPVIESAALTELYGKLFAVIQAEASSILDDIVSLAPEIREIGFYGANFEIETLLPMLTMTVAYHTKFNKFSAENGEPPFRGIDKWWYLLGVLGDEKEYTPFRGVGINTNSTKTHKEFFLFCGVCPDSRNNAAATTLFELLEHPEITPDAEKLATLVECGKVKKSENGYTVAVPVLRADEYDALVTLLSPVIQKMNALFEKTVALSAESVRGMISSHLEAQYDFFTFYFAHCVPESALFHEIEARGIQITPSMCSWFVKRA